MNRKAAARIIHAKVSKWMESLPDFLREQIKGDIIVTGGSVASLLLGEKVNDYDVYMKSKDSALAVARYYVQMFLARRKAKGGVEVPVSVVDEGDRIKIIVKSAGLAVADGEPYHFFEHDADGMEDEAYAAAATIAAELEKKDDQFRPVWLTNNAITLTGDIQIVIRFYGEPDDIHKNFDFVHCTGYWKSSDPSNLYLSEAMLHSLLTKELKYGGSKYPICSICRLRKFLARGWRINGGQILKMCYQISNLDLTNFKVLEDQLTGVDSAFFAQLIGMLKKDVENGVTIDDSYIVKLIDAIF